MTARNELDERPRKRWPRVLAWVGGSLLVLALAACAAGAYWLYAWKLGSLEFHEGWTPQERQILADFDGYVCSPERRADCRRVLHAMGGLLSLKTPQEYEEGLSWWERVEDRLGSDMLLKCLGEPTRDLLKQAAATGNADVCSPESGVSLVAQAMKYDCLDAVRLLAGKGADLNRLFDPVKLLPGNPAQSEVREGALSLLVCSANNIFKRDYPYQARKECLGYLLDHGARWDNPGQRMEMYWALLFQSPTDAYTVDEIEGLFIYALQRGYRVDWKAMPDFFQFIAPWSCSVRVLEELERRGQLGAELWQTCPLQGLCRLGFPNEHVVKAMEWLLSHGADPNATGEDSSRPLCLLVGTINYQTSMAAPDEDDRRTLNFMVQELEILLSHGAKADKTLRLGRDNMDPRVPELLTRHGVEWKWEE